MVVLIDLITRTPITSDDLWRELAQINERLGRPHRADETDVLLAFRQALVKRAALLARRLHEAHS